MFALSAHKRRFQNTQSEEPTHSQRKYYGQFLRSIRVDAYLKRGQTHIRKPAASTSSPGNDIEWYF